MSARILVIEDHPSSLELMTYLLESFGHHVLGTADGAKGHAAARSDRPDLIVCDVQLPSLDGYEIARRLKRDPALRQTPIVAVTAYAMVGDRERARDAGFDGYITKPILPETFVAEIEKLLPPSLREIGPG